MYILVILALFSVVGKSFQQSRCPSLFVTNGKITYSGITAIIQCNDGFVMQGNPVLTCVTGRWNVPQGRCVPNYCDLSRYLIGNVEVVTMVADMQVNGRQVLRVGGYAVLQCQAEGTQSTQTVVCIAPNTFNMDPVSCLGGFGSLFGGNGLGGLGGGNGLSNLVGSIGKLIGWP